MRTRVIRRTFVPALAVLSTALVLPAGAAGSSVEDPCGDNEPMVRAGSTELAPPGDRNPAFDIRRFTIADIAEDERVVGASVVLELCGDVPEPELISAWSVRWRLQGNCTGSVYLGDTAARPPVGPARIATLSKSCTTQDPPPLGGATTSVVYEVDLPTADWRVEGSRIVWELRRDADLGEGAEQVVAGTVWTAPVARSRDGRQTTQAQVGTVRVTGPGTEDSSGAGPDHTVG